MSASVRKPVAGDRVHATVQRGPVRSHEQVTLRDGSLVLNPEELALLGGGDAKEGRHHIRQLILSQERRNLDHVKHEKPQSIRIATPYDEDALVDLLMLDFEENAIRIAPIDKDKVRETVQRYTRPPPEGQMPGVFGVIDEPGVGPVATCLIGYEQWGWSRQWYLLEMINFVHPDHRRSAHVDDLLQFEQWLTDKQTEGFGYQVYMLLSVLSTIRTHTKLMLYQRRFTQVGAYFLYPSPPGA